ncbi:MAG: SDR family oxidoreductase [Candidatus Thiodiazotropha sp. (ex Dulcina madagascariensis)]|nr:SDR family oxidoreductase [Candidatus Thiodiazotropha sp. (ex Dulcina madagascariensis)]
MKKILLAGSTGYLGSYIAKELQKNAYFCRTIARNPEKLAQKDIETNEVLKAELTKPDSIKESCKGIDVVISTVGITRQKDGLTYMDVDYQANMNLLEEAKKSGVKKFIYVSVLNGEKLRHLKICNAKEMFVEQLKRSGLDYCIVRPNGFFSDMSEFFNMAKRGQVYLFGNGELKANPIHGEDLATVCVDAIDKSDKEVAIGGPEILSQNEIAMTAFEILGNEPKITHIPDGVRVAILKTVRLFTGSKVYGPVEFFLTVMAMDMLAPEYGKHTLKEYFTNLNNANEKP